MLALKTNIVGNTVTLTDDSLFAFNRKTVYVSISEEPPVSISDLDMSHMTKEQFDSAIQKGYDQMLLGKGRPAKEVFEIWK